MSDYTEKEVVVPVVEPVDEPVVEKKVKVKREGKKLSDKQKTDLTKHMEKQKKSGMSASEMKSHRMKMMSRMRNKDMSIAKAHKDVMG
tara:strand:+ start:4117 stop:4380 length:264 start_codon:yes stop_codon:yes gene_type:complete